MPWIETPRDAALHWWLGKLDQPYIWAGNEVADGGFDCSGLVNGALRKFGITDRDLRAIDLAGMFPSVARGMEAPGHLLFWNRGGRIGHVEAVYAVLDGVVFSIGAAGGDSRTTDPETAMRRDARVKVRKAPSGWIKAVDPFTQ